MTKEQAESIFGLTIQLNPVCVVSAENFSEVFSEASGQPNYNELIQLDGGVKGYKDFFDKCKLEGILI